MGFVYRPSGRRLGRMNELNSNLSFQQRNHPETSNAKSRWLQWVPAKEGGAPSTAAETPPATISSSIEISYTRARTWAALQRGGDTSILAAEAIARIQGIEQKLRKLDDFDRFSTSFASLAPCFQPNANASGVVHVISSCDFASSGGRFGSDLTVDFPNMSCSALMTVVYFEYPLSGPGSFVSKMVRYLEQSSDDIISVAFDGGSFKQTAIMTTVMDDIFLIVPSIAGVFVICATVLLRLRFAIAALLIVLLALPVRNGSFRTLAHILASTCVSRALEADCGP